MGSAGSLPSMSKEWAPVGPIPGAVHGRFVPGLPWDALPPPVWEPIEGEGPDPEAERIRELNDEYTTACDDVRTAEDELAEAEDRERDAKDELQKAFAEYARVAPGPAAVLRDELDFPEPRK